MHIGRLGVEIGRGRFVIEDLRIKGLTPECAPVAGRQTYQHVPDLGRVVGP